MTAARMNEGKPEMDFILDFPSAVEGFCRVKMLGAAKYEIDNWKKGGKPDKEYLAACMRHLFAFKRGEKFAQDSGCSHLMHAAWNLFALLELNYPQDTHDPELFNKMMKHWQDEKAKKAKGKPFPYHVGGWIEPSSDPLQAAKDWQAFRDKLWEESMRQMREEERKNDSR